jgi:Mn2+/Fe2+ NRAMP family transporter
MEKLKSLGPGLLYAGAAIGVSHLVQSTKAGAMFGYVLIIAIILANIVKYPFFEAGPRYTASTGKSLIQGYTGLGKWAIPVILIITVSTMFTIQAAVTIVTAGLAQQLFGVEWNPTLWSAILLGVCMLFLFAGKYSLLDKVIKYIMILLAITTLVALTASFAGKGEWKATTSAFDITDVNHLVFLVTLIGWMPAPLDISIWQSLWAKEKKKSNSFNLKTAIFDFKVGFWGTLVLAICFLMLGANVLFQSGVELSAAPGGYAKQLINVYTSSIGQWAFYIIAIAAFATMFSTTLTCLDAVPRVLSDLTGSIKENFSDSKEKPSDKYLSKWYWAFVLIISAGTLIVLGYFVSSMKQMVMIATVVSFLTAPVIALLNYLVLHKGDLKPEDRPSEGMKKFSQFGIVILALFALYYLTMLF